MPRHATGTIDYATKAQARGGVATAGAGVGLRERNDREREVHGPTDVADFARRSAFQDALIEEGSVVVARHILHGFGRRRRVRSRGLTVPDLRAEAAKDSTSSERARGAL